MHPSGPLLSQSIQALDTRTAGTPAQREGCDRHVHHALTFHCDVLSVEVGLGEDGPNRCVGAVRWKKREHAVDFK